MPDVHTPPEHDVPMLPLDPEDIGNEPDDDFDFDDTDDDDDPDADRDFDDDINIFEE